MNKIVVLASVFLICHSCATEKVNQSPIPSVIYNSNLTNENVTAQVKTTINTNTNVSELTNLCTKFPHFKNPELNAEISIFKTNIQNYIYALEASNRNGMDRELRNAKKSYIKIQNSRKKLSQYENEKLNSLLVKIKRNIIFLEENYSAQK